MTEMENTENLGPRLRAVENYSLIIDSSSDELWKPNYFQRIQLLVTHSWNKNIYFIFIRNSWLALAFSTFK